MRDRNLVPCSILDLFFDTHPFSSNIGSKEDSAMQLQGPLNNTLFISVEHFRATWAFKISITFVMNRTQFPQLCIPEGALFYKLVCTSSRIFPLILHHEHVEIGITDHLQQIAWSICGGICLISVPSSCSIRYLSLNKNCWITRTKKDCWHKILHGGEKITYKLKRSS